MVQTSLVAGDIFAHPTRLLKRLCCPLGSLTTLIAYLKGVCHASFSTIRKFLRDVVHVTISRGQLSAIIGKVTGALEQPYQELLARFRQYTVATPLAPRT